MTLNTGPGYGSLSAPYFSNSVSGAEHSTEAAPLLIPEQEEGERAGWRPLTREQLEEAAGGPGWRKFRFYLVLLFWFTWMALLGTAVAILIMAPKPVAQPLKWWQKSLFYQLQPQLQMEAALEGSGKTSALHEKLSYLRSLGVGALILEGLFGTEVNITAIVKGSTTFPMIQYLIQEGNKADLKVVIDFCDVDLVEAQTEGKGTDNSNPLAKDALWFWLAQGVAGFTICDTDDAYSEKTLEEWRVILKEFNAGVESIILVKQRRDTLIPLKSSNVNTSLVDVVIKSILPVLPHILSGQEVSSAIETHLYRAESSGIWNSWMVGGRASDELKNLLLVLLMTLPGSPAVEDDSDVDQTKNIALSLAVVRKNSDADSDSLEKQKSRRVAQALFSSLSQSRAREEALLYGSFSFLPFPSSNSTFSPRPSALAFLRSWGCVHFLILLNIGVEPHTLDPVWFPSLPEAGVFVASTGMDRLGATSLNNLVLQPYEAIVIKLFEAGAYS
uniref:Solute carrier family 3 member 2 N-terminal domain-containing protein n=1 Tax=Knipowitschia caucasica TaxID=637954 RepID=A0AAV2J561_KNICA